MASELNNNVRIKIVHISTVNINNLHIRELFKGTSLEMNWLVLLTANRKKCLQYPEKTRRVSFTKSYSPAFIGKHSRMSKRTTLHHHCTHNINVNITQPQRCKFQCQYNNTVQSTAL